MSYDDRIRVDIDDDIAEPGGSFTGTLSRTPLDGGGSVDSSNLPMGAERSIRVALIMRTEGRGDVDQRTIAEVGVELDRFGSASTPFSLRVPPDGPISYDGRLIRVVWEIAAITDRKLAFDKRTSAPVVVVPRGGHGHYRYPHPRSS